jgi:hypothetical protein
MTTATPAMTRGELLWSPAPDALERTRMDRSCTWLAPVEMPVKRILQGAPVDSAVSRDSLIDPDALDAVARWRSLEREDS